jgi:small GTP-binding protein
LDGNIIKGIIYSQFNEKLGPSAVAWVPSSLTVKANDLISLKAINILTGEGKIPSTLSIIPFPSINMKGLIKLMGIRDKTRRGGVIDSSITLLFSEFNDLVFYKYITNFEEVFTESATKIVELEEAKAEKEIIKDELNKLYNNSIEILNELRDSEIAMQETEAFPKEKEEILDYRFKIIVCGDPEVGKTSVVLRFTNKAFKKTYIPTIGVNISEKKVYLEDENAETEFVIWDIAGQTKFQIMRRHFYKGADGLLLIFDLTRPSTFKNIANWYQDIKALLKVDLFGYILGNKSDLIDQRKVSSEEIANLTKQLDLEYIETSALSGENVDNAFYRLAEVLINQRKKDAEKK